jgi:hypothetical protein
VSVSLARTVLKILMFNATVTGKLADSPLSQMPAFYVQAVSVYGHKSGNSADDFITELRQAMGSNVRLLVIPAFAEQVDVKKCIQSVSKPHMIVWKDFHNWSIDVLSCVLSELSKNESHDPTKSKNRLSECTHLVILGNVFSLGVESCGNAVLWELLAMAEKYNELRGASLLDDNVATSNLKFLQNARFQKNGAGDSSTVVCGDHLYPIEKRREQWDANSKIWRWQHCKKREDVCSLICRTISSAKTTIRVVFLTARFITLNRIRRIVRQKLPQVLDQTVLTIQTRTFRDLERQSFEIFSASVDFVVIDDVDYNGPGRLNYLHLNTVIEHTKSGVIFVEPQNDIGQSTLSKSMQESIEDIFFGNDSKSERYLQSLARCTLAQNRFLQFLNTESVKQKLQSVAHTDPVDAQDARKSDED